MAGFGSSIPFLLGRFHSVVDAGLVACRKVGKKNFGSWVFVIPSLFNIDSQWANTGPNKRQRK